MQNQFSLNAMRESLFAAKQAPLWLRLCLLWFVIFSWTNLGFAQIRSVSIAPQVDMQFRWIEPGRFRMGSPPGETRRDSDEGPSSEVTITAGYYLGVYEVTQKQWHAVMGQNPSTFQQGESPLDRPVESVSWNDCQRFIQRLNELGVGTFKLPSEAEWEYACRGGTTSPFYWGEVQQDWEAHPHAWANSRSFATTHPVGQKPPNPWGLHDMSGNVWEWCQDWYGPYPTSDRSDPAGPGSGTAKVFRGGSYYDFPHSLRSANRHRHKPNERYSAIGLRLVWQPRPNELEDAITLPIPGGQTIQLVRIPAGTFKMGSPTDEVGRQNDEGPQHAVKINEPFYLGRFEITQGQWQSVMGSNPSTFQRLEQSPKHPVERVSWEDAQEFIGRLNEPQNRVRAGQFSLPTEAEWEYACRAGSTSRFPWGEDPTYRQLLEFAWFNSRSEGMSHPVGGKRPNRWGLYDMHGNVWEWCDSSFAAYPASDPDADDTTEQTESAVERKVIRGGSWFNEPEALRSANRHRHPLDSRQTNLGFRVLWRPISE